MLALSSPFLKLANARCEPERKRKRADSPYARNENRSRLPVNQADAVVAPAGQVAVRLSENTAGFARSETRQK